MKQLSWLIFVVLLFLIGSAAEGAQRRSLSDCAADWNNPTVDDVCFDLTNRQWFYYDGSNWTATPAPSTVASLPGTCIEGEQRRLTDGDAAGAYVQCDGSNTWRAPAEIAYQIINPALPPYNCDKDDSGAVNDACMVVLEDRLTSDILSPDDLRPTVRWVAKYTITQAVTFDYGANTTALLDWEGSAAIGGGLICDFTTTVTGCLTFTTSGSTLNGFSFENFFIGGGTNAPDILLNFPDGAAQVTWTGGGLARFHWRGWSGKCDNCQFVGLTISMANFTPDGAGFGESWFFDMFQLRKTEMSNISIEVTNNDLNLGFLNARAQPSGLSITNVNCIGDGVRLKKFLVVTGSAGLDPKNILVQGVSCQQVREIALDISATSGQRVLGLRIIGNSFERSTGAGGTTGISVTRADSPIIIGNQVSDFVRGISLATVDNAIVTDNRVTGAQVGIELESSFSGNLVEQNVLKDVTLVGLDSSTGSLGGNIVENNNLIGTIPTTPYGLSGWDASDFVVFGNMPYTLTCDDDAAGTIVTKTDVPFQANVYIDNDDTSGGCQWDMGNGTFPGALVTTRFLSTVSAQPIKVSGDGGTNCVTLASSGIDRRAEWEWDGADWILQSGPTPAAC